ncbi:hypothetical protein NBE98_18880 [Clostridium swellfunianum]|uniref:DUF6115 domain-containing protein n=1 Tax=Clostridium swellfunianum TaxID=1367462 RepID=UPI00202EA10C|nr:hypothetical protein [Clostridium swellfunianum]MCM0650431.1 hypothetical protein [Clostridium swellfunianum]
MGFLLIIIGTTLIIFNIKAIKREKNSFKNVFHNKEEELAEFEVRLGVLRREFSETILELQKQIIELKKENIEDVITYTKENEKSDEELTEVIEDKKNDIPSEDSEVKKENNTKGNSVKIEEINKLLEEGFSVEDVSVKLGVGKGEVLLIKELYLK